MSHDFFSLLTNCCESILPRGKQSTFESWFSKKAVKIYKRRSSSMSPRSALKNLNRLFLNIHFVLLTCPKKVVQNNLVSEFWHEWWTPPSSPWELSQVCWNGSNARQYKLITPWGASLSPRFVQLWRMELCDWIDARGSELNGKVVSRRTSWEIIIKMLIINWDCEWAKCFVYF